MAMRMGGEEEGGPVGRGVWWRRWHRGAVDVQAWILFFPLGPAVLEPDLYLCLGEGEREREVQPLTDREVPGGLEFVFQGDELLVGEGRPSSSGLTASTAAATIVVAASTAAAGCAVALRGLTVLVLATRGTGG